MTSERHPDDIVCLAKAANPMQAHIWEQALRDEGIEAKVVGDFLDAGIGNIPGVRAEVWVHRDDKDRAEAVLRAGEAKPDTSEEEGSDAGEPA